MLKSVYDEVGTTFPITFSTESFPYWVSVSRGEAGGSVWNKKKRRSITKDRNVSKKLLWAHLESLDFLYGETCSPVWVWGGDESVMRQTTETTGQTHSTGQRLNTAQARDWTQHRPETEHGTRKLEPERSTTQRTRQVETDKWTHTNVKTRHRTTQGTEYESDQTHCGTEEQEIPQQWIEHNLRPYKQNREVTRLQAEHSLWYNTTKTGEQYRTENKHKAYCLSSTCVQDRNKANL